MTKYSFSSPRKHRVEYYTITARNGICRCSRRETLYVVKSGTREPVRSTIPSDFLQSFFKDRVRPLPQKTTKNPSITYADAGVDIDRGNKTKKRIKYLAHKTFTKGVLSEIGGFGGLFAIDKTKYQDPVLVSSVDGVGTKLKLPLR